MAARSHRGGRRRTPQSAGATIPGLGLGVKGFGGCRGLGCLGVWKFRVWGFGVYAFRGLGFRGLGLGGLRV